MNTQIGPVRNFDPIEKVLTYGVHPEWNVRDLEIQDLGFGQKYVSWVFRDDGPVWNGRRRHPDIPVAFVLPEHFDWIKWKAQLWRALEHVKKTVTN
jgi:hypothetical protein